MADCADLTIDAEAFKYMEIELEVHRDKEYAGNNDRKRATNEDLAKMIGGAIFGGGRNRAGGAEKKRRGDDDEREVLMQRTKKMNLR